MTLEELEELNPDVDSQASPSARRSSSSRDAARARSPPRRRRSLLGLAAPAAAQAPDAPASRRSRDRRRGEHGRTVFEKRAEQPRPIASTTKLMTALLTLETAPLDDVLTAAPYDPAPAESVVGLRRRASA